MYISELRHRFVLLPQLDQVLVVLVNHLFYKKRKEIVYTSRCVRVILAQGPC